MTARGLSAIAVLAPLVLACGSSTKAPPAAMDAGAMLSPNGDPPACAPGAAGPGGGGPTPRGDAAGALDAAAKHFVVFGGDTAVSVCGAIPSHTHAGDTWMLDVGCGSWHQVSGDGPGARARHAMVTDAPRGRALLFGGRTRAAASGPYTLYSDVWSFDFTSEQWQAVGTSGDAPSARSNTAAVVDKKGQKLVVFGGSTSTDGQAYVPQADAFAMDLVSGAWTKIAAAGGPPARLFHAMAIDAEARVVYVFGGGNANALTATSFYKDLWALDLAAQTWSLVSTGGETPFGRINATMTFDQAAGRLVLFAGHDDGVVGNQNDVYVLDVHATPALWKKLATGDAQNKMGTGMCTFPADFTKIDLRAPERRSAFAAGARADGRAFVVFGGKGDCGVLGDVWWWSDGGEGWSPIKASPVGLSCLRTSTTCSGLCG